MCGIVVAFSPRQPTTLGTVVAMTRLLRHRGPDGEGYALLEDGRLRLLAGADTPAAVRSTPTPSQPDGEAEAHAGRTGTLLMGHRRLAIVDLSAHGHQPMRRDALCVVFNGELYNHVELRAELAAQGERFDSHSDTEVLLAAWQRWGVDALSRFNGMWAFALHDAGRRRLVLARDRFGVKPLYWWQGPGGELLLASEIKALLAHPRVAAQADPAACRRFLAEGCPAWEEGTPFQGIRRFPAGHWAELDLDAPGALQPRRWWSRPPVDAAALAAPFDPRTADELAARYRELLDDAVRVRMRMDVRFGTALSGGLDSSQIASRVNAELRRRGASERQEVFSSVYAGRGADAALAAGLRRADESRFVAEVASHLDVRSNTIEPQWQAVPAEHERLLWALDLPPTNSLMSSWHTYALVARRGVVVTLDGQGADEQLAGYPHYLRHRLVHATTGEALREAWLLHEHRAAPPRTLALALGAHLLARLGGRRALAALAGDSARGGRLRGIERTLPQALAADFDTHLQTLLHYGDQTSMAWSVESRMPFMDVRLVEFLAGVPAAYLVHGGWTKWLARHALGSQLPPAVVWRRDKLGWAIPEDAWFGAAGPLAGWLAATVDGSAFARDVAAGAGIDPRRAAWPLRLRLANLAVWHRLFFEEPGRPGRALGRGAPGEISGPADRADQAGRSDRAAAAGGTA